MEIRPLTEDDVEAAAWVQVRSLGELYATPERPYSDPPPETMARRQARVRHCLTTDPAGAWVAADDDGLSGVALAIRRGPLWLLSLLAVRGDVQGQGVGRALLDACHVTSAGSSMALILASEDPKALRRYHSLGFALEPSYSAEGPLDRSLIPAGLDVRDGDWAGHGGLCADVVRGQRGADHGPELGHWASIGQPLLVVDEGPERGFATMREGLVATVAATSPAVATRLLWAALALTTEGAPADISWMSGRTPWAVDVAMALRLPLASHGSLCRRGALGPMTTYLPSGAYG